MSVKLRLTTLTPLWTGDLGMKMPAKPKITGLGGSFRWWYEAIARGLGMRACDPTANDSCQSKEGDLDNVCAACRLFGCTGWAQMFRVTTSGRLTAVLPELHYQSGREGGRGWYLRGGGCGNVDLHIKPLRQSQVGDPPNMPRADIAMRVVFSLVARWAAVGARTQLGYGVPNFLARGAGEEEETAMCLQDSNIDEVIDGIRAAPPRGGAPTLPSLDCMLFAKFPLATAPTAQNPLLRQAANSNAEGWEPEQGKKVTRWVTEGCLPIAPAFRNHLRYIYQRDDSLLVPNRSDQPLFFGSASHNKQASKFNIACYKKPGSNDWEIRFWCWLPPTLGTLYSNAGGRAAFVESLYDYLTDAGLWDSLLGCSGVVDVTNATWREMNGAAGGRCTGCPAGGCSDGESFLRCLLA